MEQVDLAKLNDSELSPKQLKNREKNREKRKRKQAGAVNPAPANTNKTPAKTPAPVADVRKSREEMSAERLKRKTDRLESNPDSSVVSVAETNEARALAVRVNEVNAITAYTRDNLGVDQRMSFEVGLTILKKFNENVIDALDAFMQVAHAHGVGSKRSLKEHEEKQRKSKNIEKQNSIVLEKSIALENEVERKDREQDDKDLIKSEQNLAKAEEELAKAQDTLEKSQVAYKTTKQQVLDRLFDRYKVQKAREQEKIAAERASNEEAKRAAKALEESKQQLA